MANDQLLFLKLAEALGQPSKAYRAAQAGLDIPTSALKGYEEGSQIGDAIRNRKLQKQTLSEALGVAPEGFGNLSVEQANNLVKPVEAYAALQKAEHTDQPKAEDFLTPDQATKALVGAQGKVTPEDQAYLASFTGGIPRQDFATYFNGKINKQNANARSDLYGTRSGQINLQQLPSELGPNTAAGAAYQVKVASRQGKKLVAAPGPAQNISLATSDLARAVQRSAPQLDVLYGADYSKNFLTRISALKQKFDADPNGPDAPKIRKALYDEFNALDQSATPFIENHLKNYDEMLNPLPESVRQRELGNTLPDIPFQDGLQRKTYQKTARNAQGLLIGTNDNWATFEPVQQ